MKGAVKVHVNLKALGLSHFQSGSKVDYLKGKVAGHGGSRV
jgi:hypothetical protein